MRTGVIIQTKPGLVASKQFIEHVLTNNASCVGFAVYSGKKLHIERKVRPDLKNMMEVFEGLKANKISAHFANYPEGWQVLADDIQPYVLIEDADKKPLVACMLDGDWVTTAPADDNHSDEYFVAMKQLRPMFEQLHRWTKGDIGAMLEEIDSDATKNSIVNMFINRGSVHLLFNNGQTRTITQNPLEMEYPWGWASNRFLYTELPKPADPPKAVVEDNPLAALIAGGAMPEVKASLEPNPKEAAMAEKALADATGPKKVSCPRETKNPNKIQGWYKHNAGFVPPDFMSYPLVEVRPKNKGPVAAPIKLLSDLGPALAGPAGATRILPDVGSTPEDIAKRIPPKVGATGPKVLPPVANVTPIKQPDKPVETKPVEVVEPKKDAVPSMSPETQQKLVDSWMKETATMVTTMDRSGNPITDPKDAPLLEKEHTPFAERLGIKEEEVFGWSVERLEKLLYEYPDAALQLLCELRRDKAKVLKAVATKPAVGTLIPPKVGVRKTG